MSDEAKWRFKLFCKCNPDQSRQYQSGAQWFFEDKWLDDSPKKGDPDFQSGFEHAQIFDDGWNAALYGDTQEPPNVHLIRIG